MFCNNCGQQNAEGVRFCSSCGAPLMAEAPAQAPVDADATVRVRVQSPVQEQYAPVQQAPVEQYAPVQQAPYQAPVEQYAPVQQTPYEAPVQQAPYQAPYQAPADPYAVPQYGAPAPQKSNGKMIGIIVGVVAAIAAIVVVLVLVLGGGTSAGDDGLTAEDVAEKYAVASCEFDTAALVDTMPDFALLKESKALGKDGIDKSAIVASYEQQIGTMGSQIGDVEYEVLDIEVDSDWDKKDSILSGIKNEYGSSAADSVSDVCCVNVKLTINGNENTMPVIVIKENGNWRAFGVD